MQVVKIQIPDAKESARALGALIRNGRVDCYRDDVYIVAARALDLLAQLGVTYIEIERGDLDYAAKSLRGH